MTVYMDKTSIALIKEAQEILKDIKLAEGDIRLANDLMENRDSDAALHINNVMQNYLFDLLENYGDIQISCAMIAALN